MYIFLRWFSRRLALNDFYPLKPAKTKKTSPYASVVYYRNIICRQSSEFHRISALFKNIIFPLLYSFTCGIIKKYIKNKEYGKWIL